MKPFALLRVLALAGPLLLITEPVLAQANPPKDTLSDAERAKRDAEKVFSFLKFSTVKPATPPAAKPAAAPVRTAAASSGNKSPAAPGLASTASAAATATPAAASSSSTAVNAETGGEPGSTLTAAGPPLAAPGAEARPSAAATLPDPAPAAAEPEPEEVPLKLIAYTAPELNNKLLDLIGDRRINVPVRFKVEADGSVSAAQALGRAPRALELAAVRAVQRWRFAPLPAGREVDVELAFQAGG